MLDTDFGFAFKVLSYLSIHLLHFLAKTHVPRLKCGDILTKDSFLEDKYPVSSTNYAIAARAPI